MRQLRIPLVGLLLALPACGQNGLEQEGGPLRLVEAFPSLSFSNPVDFQVPGDESNRIFVVEQEGIIRVFANDSSAEEAAVFLDVRDRVVDGGERGLLGLAFHPQFAANGQFFVDYTAPNPLRTVISRFEVDPNDPNAGLPGSEEVILEVDQPFGNHNAGAIAFGPDDGYLYVTFGDGGSGGDPEENGEDPTTLLGSILRIDVDRGDPYAIPPDNPFVGNNQNYREEIFAYGLRNPWRISFDPETMRLWAGDVGQNQYEEVDVIESGGNYGWDVMEGMHCYEPRSRCDQTGLILPVWEYDHDLGQSITGGYVYRGSDVASLVGKYVYADFVSGRIWALTYDGGEAKNEELLDSNLATSSFGVDQDRELYVLAFNGKIYRMTAQAEAQ